jgi:hypothetical protein
MCRGSRTVTEIVCRKSHTVAQALAASLVSSSSEIKRNLLWFFYASLEPNPFEHNLRLEHNLARR